MINILLIGLVTALPVLAILAKTCRRKPKRVEKWEKGEIIKQLLALSNRENSVSAIAPLPDRNPQPTSARTIRMDALRPCTGREQNSKRRYSPMCTSPAISVRSNRTNAIIEEQIRQRAYELYQRRGGGNGNATDDWLQAEEEVCFKKAQGPTTSS
jgi:Protein of unknown function (DUF2934)